MIIVKLVSGLGNQLFQYVLARQISIKTGLPLKLDISHYDCQDLRSFKLDKYNIKADIISKEEVIKYKMKYVNKIYSKILNKLDHYLPKHSKRFYVEDKWWTYEPNIFKISSKVYIEGYWQHYKYYENVDSVILDELKLLKNYVQPVQKISNQISEDNYSVAVHIRRGDYITDNDANKLMGVLPIDYYLSAFKFIKTIVKNPSFYFFSDDLNWVENNFKYIDNSYYVDSEKDYLDLHLMSQCKHTVIANSSFSWWAGFLNKNPEKVVICPQQWVIPHKINQGIEIQFPNWTKL